MPRADCELHSDLTQQCAFFGGHVEIIEVDELAALRTRVTNADMAARVKHFHRLFEVQSDCAKAELERAARTSVALDRLTAEHQLGSLAYFYSGTGNAANEDTITSIILGTSLLTARGLLLREGTLVDATLIAAPPSTKNLKKERDPEMHQTKKGNQWYFGMKAHIGADRDSKLVHTVVVTAANVADVTKTSELLHGAENQVHADAGYIGVEKRAEIVALERKIDWQIAGKRGAIKALAEGVEKEAIKAVEKAKASVRAFVEHPFHIVKNIFRHRKVRYRGLAKNGHQLYTLFGLANVVIGSRTATS